MNTNGTSLHEVFIDSYFFVISCFMFWGVAMRCFVLFWLCVFSSVAYCHEWNIFAAKPIDSKACKCNGKKPCSCGENCQCKKTQAKPVNRILMFTASWCGPCQQWKRDEVPALKAAGWKVGTADTSHIQYIDTDANPETTERYQVRSIPQFVVIDPGGKEVARRGYMDAVETADFYYTNQVKK